MRLTLRKFYLRLGEWQDAQRDADSRAYKMIAPHLKDPPDPGDIFPSLRGRSQVRKDVDDDAVFQQVAASFAKYSGK